MTDISEKIRDEQKVKKDDDNSIHEKIRDEQKVKKDDDNSIPKEKPYRYAQDLEIIIDSHGNEENSVEDILSLNKLIDNNSFNDIDFLVTNTNEIYLEAAKKSVSFKANFKKSIMQRQTKKAKLKKVWMSNDYLLLGKEVCSLGNRLAKAPNNNALRLTDGNCKREYSE
ncbi:unnamed protein product [Mytilus coruscus]|uniref:Uncharacterized protein n=1 Tax=Mytilus coruscus TaxID=42192 RepID=A0A6J8B452_MYTCO|nr:unnamed protein product [Mytilus coruscus]